MEKNHLTWKPDGKLLKNLGVYAVPQLYNPGKKEYFIYQIESKVMLLN